ncbi:MAG: hypothetical protein LIR25_02130 [bacterium]|jgi:hypothetical protein|nr:hypothetical protein [Spirochaetales bacterium]MDT3389384.1 hypothetical protein [bacterium]
MALKRNPEDSVQYDEEISVSSKAKQLFTSGTGKRKAETKILTTFSIEPSFKKELEELFSDMGLSWAGGIRFSLKEFLKKYKNQ